MRGGRGSLLVHESTAADRAAADMRRVGTHMERLQQLDSCWSLSHAVLEKPTHRSPCWLVAAALSAAVTSSKPIGDAPNSQAEPSQKKSTPPNANRSSGERGLGGEALLSEKRPLPPASPYPRLFRREREGGGFSTEKPPPSQSLIVPLAMPLFAWYHRVDGICAAEGA